MSFNNHNNFDLVRLFAALQVAICHSAGHFGYQNFAITLLGYFPGVPIFFFVSGFLIYSSYEKSKENQKPLFNFYQKRFLRLYPAAIPDIPAPITTTSLCMIKIFLSYIVFAELKFLYEIYLTIISYLF